jgi:hypothetical protein
MKRFVAAVSVSVLAFVAACGKDPAAPDPTKVTAVIVTAPSPSLQVGGTMQATARLINSVGDEVTTKTASWASSNTSIATVDQTGLITAVAAGAATITASADDARGTLPLTVDIDRCANPLSLNVGQVSVFSGPAAVSCITIAASSAATQYLFITANATTTPDNKQTFNVSFQGGTAAATASPSPALSISPEVQRVAASLSHRDEVERRIRATERSILRAMPRSRIGGARSPAPGVNANVVVAAVDVGDTVAYRVPNVNGNLCTDYVTVRGAIKAAGRRVQIALDVNAPTGFTNNDFASIAAEFDDLIYRTDTLWFGSPTDINRDNRITILYSPEVNKFTPRGSSSYIGGFFWGGDLFTQADWQAAGQPCPQTNEQEIFYLLAADPTGTFGDARSTALVRQSTRGTIAHEMQHMINQGIRQFNENADPFEVDWLNEALSHFAEEAVGRAARNFTDFQSLSFTDIRANTEDYAAYFQQNLARFSTWLARPDTSSPISSRADQDLAPRGAGWALLRYTADHFSPGTPGNARLFFRRLVAGPRSSVTNLVEKAGVPFDQIISGWLIANYTDNLGVPGLDARYSYTSWNMRDAVAGAVGGTYPLRVLTPGAPVTTTAQSGSGVYFLANRAAGSPQATFRMRDQGGGNVNFQGARVYVVRLN